MNLDNYFARFLHKSTNKAAPKKEEPTPNVAIAVTPARPASLPSEVVDARRGTAPSTLSTAGDAAVGQQFSTYSPDEAANKAVSSPTSYKRAREAGNTVADNYNEEEDEEDVTLLPSSPSASSAPLIPRNTTTACAAGASAATGAQVRRTLAPRGAMHRGEDGDDDDDELALLLGSQEARQVREIDALLETASVTSPTAARSAETVSNTATACAVGSLAWAKGSARTLETYAGYFQRQFEYELHHSSALFNVFEPFFKDRALARIAADTELRQVFYAAPTVSNDSVAALPGCVLRSYQVEGVQFMLNHFHEGMPCILADDMGLGKTAQISAFLHTLKQLHGIEGPHLIIAPLSTLTSWTRELARWAPQLRVVKYHGERKTRLMVRAGHHNRHAVFVTTPALVGHDKGFFRKRSWVTVIVDEAHVLKSHDTAITSVSRKLTSCYRVAVTGTPVHNNVQEVWSLMSFLYPWLIAGYDPSVRDPVRQAEECAAVLRTIMLRRTKADMELGIPPRVDEPLTKLTPTYVQRHLLAQLTTHALREANTGQQLHGHLSHQRAVCNHPLTLRLLADEGRGRGGQESVEARMQAAGIAMDAAHLIDPSAKMRYLSTLLPKLKAEGHRCLIFSNFTTTLDLLEAMCVLYGYSYERLDGGCNRVERELSMLRFNHPTSSCFLFLVTTTAGGVGVTLTGADTVILFDAHFNPQLDRQAADRAHRIGQTRTVHVYRLCLEGTVEEHIREIAARKASLGDFIVEGGGQRSATRGGHRGSNAGEESGGGGGGGAGRVTADDIRELFRRLEEQKTQSALGGGSPTSQWTCEDAGEGHAAENAMVQDLLQVEEDGLPGSAAAAQVRRGGGVGNGGGGLANPPKQSNVCFCCGDIMHAMEPLYHCLICPKAYHAQCIGERTPKPGESLKRQWTCPRHVCSLCGKPQAADGAIFMCDACPRSFCFDCLDPRYLEMDAAGAHLLHIRDTYADMAKDEMEVRRSCYYITCLHCCGVVTSSSSSSSSSSAASSEGGREVGDVDSDDFEVIESDDEEEEDDGSDEDSNSDDGSES